MLEKLCTIELGQRRDWAKETAGREGDVQCHTVRDKVDVWLIILL